MSIAKHIEVTAESTQSFEDAVRTGISKVGETVQGITSAWVKDQVAVVENGAVSAYRVNMKVTFIVKD